MIRAGGEMGEGNSGDCRADEKWEQVCGWVGLSGDEERRENSRASAGLVEKSIEGTWESGNVAGEERLKSRLSQTMCIGIPLLPYDFSFLILFCLITTK